MGDFKALFPEVLYASVGYPGEYGGVVFVGSPSQS